jgi:voltage-gated sodium channel|tara:strand:+ start:2944 stop:3705 length:762 start_codon:yes stop_codon:yes gene_type:complete
MRQFIDFFLSIRDSKFFTGLVISVIVASAIYAGASSYDIPNQYTIILDYFDYAITVFFLVEILIRIFAEANHPVRFFKNGWNVFDFIIVVVSLVPVDGAESAFVARLLRIVRVLRIITVVPAFRHIVESLFKSMPRVAFIALLMFIVIYIWAAIGTLIYSETDPEHWRNIGIAALTLAQVATYDDWAAVMTNVLDAHPYSWIYFISFILVTSVVLLNMVIGIIVDVMSRDARENLFDNIDANDHVTNKDNEGL